MKQKLCLLVLLTSGLSTFALADEMDAACMLAKAKPFSVSLGLANFTSGATKDFTRSQNLSLGLGYKLGIPCLIAPGMGMPGIEFTYLTSSNNGNRLSNFGVTAGSKIFLDKKMSTYGSFGLGVFSTNTKSRAAVQNAESRLPSPGTSKSVSRFGAKIGLGYKSEQGIFVEGNYFLLGKRSGLNNDHFSLMVGIDF